MRNLTSIVLLCLFFSCQEKKMTHTFVTPEILTDSIYTRMPGDLIVCGDQLVWSDPFSKKDFLHVVDSKTGEEIGTMAKIGQGPEEFITPGVSAFVRNRHLYVSDANSPRTGYFSLDSFLLGKKYRIDLAKNPSYSDKLGENFSLINSEEGNTAYFKATIGGEDIYFGKFPIENESFYFWGEVAYSPINEYLVYAVGKFPYLALYKKEGKNLSLVWERKEVPEYRISDNRIFFEGERSGARGVVLLKDYIVTIERDRNVDKTDESKVGRDDSKLPHTVYIYDYDSNLKQILNFQMPISRIGGEANKNTIYMIVANPEYAIAKYEIQ